MPEEIINRIASSKLLTIDLEELYPSGERKVVDIGQWLFQGLVLREKEFREQVKAHDWTQYNNTYVALTCSADAIVPSWAYLLVSTYLEPYAQKTVVGDLATLETVLFTELLQSLDVSPYENKPVIIKGCSRKPVPESAYIQLMQKIQPIAKSIMYGEACSSVPLYKKKK